MQLNVTEGTMSLIQKELVSERGMTEMNKEFSSLFAKKVFDLSIRRLKKDINEVIDQETHPLVKISLPRLVHPRGHHFGFTTHTSDTVFSVRVPERKEPLFSFGELGIDEDSNRLSREYEDILSRARQIVQGAVEQNVRLKGQVDRVFEEVWDSNPSLLTYLHSDILVHCGHAFPKDVKVSLNIDILTDNNPYRMYLTLQGEGMERMHLFIDDFGADTLLSDDFPSILLGEVERVLQRRVQRVENDIKTKLDIQSKMSRYDGVTLLLEASSPPLSFNFPKDKWTLPKATISLNSSLEDVERAKTLFRFGHIYRDMPPVVKRVVRRGFTLRTAEEMGGQPFNFEDRTISTSLTEKDLLAFKKVLDGYRAEVASFEQARLFSSVAETERGLPLEIFFRQTSEFEFEGHHYRVFHFKGISRRLKMHVFRNGVLIPNRTYHKAMRRRRALSV